jgi:hypothetical protein
MRIEKQWGDSPRRRAGRDAYPGLRNAVLVAMYFIFAQPSHYFGFTNDLLPIICTVLCLKIVSCNAAD